MGEGTYDGCFYNFSCSVAGADVCIPAVGGDFVSCLCDFPHGGTDCQEKETQTTTGSTGGD